MGLVVEWVNEDARQLDLCWLKRGVSIGLFATQTGNAFVFYFSRVGNWRRAGAAFELFDARIYLEL